MAFLSVSDSTVERVQWIVLATGSALVAAFAARNLIKASWRVFTDEDPPLNPARRDTDWTEAALFTVSTAVAAGLARLVARRGAASGWERIKGFRPPF